MDNERFSEIVTSDVRNKLEDPELIAWLRSPEVLDRWYDELVNMCRKIDGQITGSKLDRAKRRLQYEEDRNHKEWQAWLIEHQDWRMRILRLKRAAEERLAECKALRRDLYRDNRARALEEVERLRAAIADHQEAFDGDDASEEDKELWAVLRA